MRVEQEGDGVGGRYEGALRSKGGFGVFEKECAGVMDLRIVLWGWRSDIEVRIMVKVS